MAAMAALPEGIVAFVLTDLEGSTRLWESLPGAMRKAMVQQDAILGGAGERNDGALDEAGREGDSGLAAFRNTSTAASCSLGFQRANLAANWPPGVTRQNR